MPNRILREGILYSERVNALSPGAEIFYRRLMSCVDDYGRSEAHPAILRGKLYALQLDRVSEADIQRHMSECCDEPEPLIVVYTVNRKRYLQIQNFGQRARTASKCPGPECEQAAREMPAEFAQGADKCPHDDGLVGGVGVCGDGGEGERGSARTPPLRSLPSWTLDANYVELKRIADEAGAPTVEEDWTQAHYLWRILDLSQRMIAIQNLRKRFTEGGYDPSFFRPQKYLANGEYKRPVVPPKARGTPVRNIDPVEALKGL
jgi:hypothetical protein